MPPTSSINTPNPFHEYPWLHHNLKTTLYLPEHMPCPKQGYLKHDPSTNTWSFIPGRNKSAPPIELPNFALLAPSLISNKKLFWNWPILNTPSLPVVLRLYPISLLILL